MSEMYWITRLDAVCVISTIIFILTLIMYLGLTIWNGIAYDDDEKVPKKYFRILLIVFLVNLPILVFVPSEKDMYKIIGIGGTYDYLKQNETAKQLPDKVINALDKLIDQQNEKLAKEKESN